MFEQTNNNVFTVNPGTQDSTVTRSFMNQVFGWMTLAMFITAFTAYLFATTPSLIMSLFNFETHQMTGPGWFVTLAPIGFVLLMSFGFQRLSPVALTLLFVAFSVLMGMSLSFILLVYTTASVFKTFVVTAVMFGVMAITGYTTKTDLTKFGSIMMMGLIGMGNNPMVGASVAVAVALEQAS